MQNAVLAAAVVAVVEFVKRIIPSVSGAVTVAVAAALGLVAGLAHLDGLSVTQGVLIALAAVGTHAVASQVGGTV